MINIFLTLSCFISIIFFHFSSYAKIPYPSSAVSSSDNNYYIYKTKKYWIIFDKQYKNIIHLINKKIHHYLVLAEISQETKFKKPLIVILISDKKQVSNALASLFPFLQLQIYPTGVRGIDNMAMPYWFDTVFVHELTHTFQINHSLAPYPLKNIFKTPRGVFFGFFFFIYPNITLPSIFIEGDAVLKESLIHRGGRLYSGFTRALVYSQIRKYRNKKNKFIKNHLINIAPTPFSKFEKYSHGAYLFSALSEIYPHKQLNKFFKINVINNFIFPWSYNASLISAFDMDIDDLTSFYFNRYYSEAYLQRSSSKKALFKSANCEPFNRYGDNILFLVSDKKSTPSLIIYNTKTKIWTNSKMDLPVGKIFRIADRYYSRTSFYVHPNVVKYSLFSKKWIPHKNFISKYVEDLKNGNVLYIDVKNNIENFKLFLNNEFYDNIHSNALFGPDQSIYYFKQKESIRTLYKNKQPVFSYKGFYGSVIDIDEEGSVYFIASSPFGSSIYKYRNNEIIRSSASDTVIQAKKINNHEFIVCEVSADFYEYKIIPEEEIADFPAFYYYHYKDQLKPHNNDEQSNARKDQNLEIVKENLNFDSLNDESLDFEDIYTRELNSKKKSPLLKYKKYNPLLNLNFSGIQFTFNVNSSNVYFKSSFLFTDYLQHNILNISYLNHSIKFNRLMVQYFYRAYRLNVSLGYHYSWLKSIFELNLPNYFFEDFPVKELSYFLNFHYPLLKKGRWSSNVSLFNTYIDEVLDNMNPVLRFFKRKIKEKYYYHQALVWRGSWNILYSQNYPLEYFQNKFFSFSTFLNYSKDLGGVLDELKWGHTFYSIYNLGYEFYFVPVFHYSSILVGGYMPITTQIHNYWSETILDESQFIKFQTASYLQSINRYTYPFFHDLKLYSKSAGSISLGLKKVFYTPVYFKIFPLSMIRFIPFINYQYLILQYSKNLKKNKTILTTTQNLAKWIEWSTGIESQWLLYYKIPFSLGVSFGLSYQMELSSPPPFYFNFYIRSFL